MTQEEYILLMQKLLDEIRSGKELKFVLADTHQAILENDLFIVWHYWLNKSMDEWPELMKLPREAQLSRIYVSLLAMEFLLAMEITE